MEELELKSEPLQPRWYSTDEFESLKEGANRWRNGVRSHIWRPATDVYETIDSIVRVEVVPTGIIRPPLLLAVFIIRAFSLSILNFSR